MPSPATFLLTRNAALNLRRIHARSRREWGDDVADQYLADLYAVLTVQLQVRDIEYLIADLTQAFHAEVERLKRKA